MTPLSLFSPRSSLPNPLSSSVDVASTSGSRHFLTFLAPSRFFFLSQISICAPPFFVDQASGFSVSPRQTSRSFVFALNEKPAVFFFLFLSILSLSLLFFFLPSSRPSSPSQPLRPRPLSRVPIFLLLRLRLSFLSSLQLIPLSITFPYSPSLVPFLSFSSASLLSHFPLNTLLAALCSHKLSSHFSSLPFQRSFFRSLDIRSATSLSPFSLFSYEGPLPAK